MTASYSVQSLLQLLALCVKTLEPLIDEELNMVEEVEKMEVFFSQTLAVLYKTLWYVNIVNYTQCVKPYKIMVTVYLNKIKTMWK